MSETRIDIQKKQQEERMTNDPGSIKMNQRAAKSSELPCGAVENGSKQKPRSQAFPVTTYHMINYLSRNYPDVASWSSSGEIIIIKDKIGFANFLSEFFNTKQFETFAKQMNVYGFLKLQPQWVLKNNKVKIVGKSRNLDSNFDRWWHPCFHRDSEEKLHMITPKSNRKKRNSPSNGQIKREIKSEQLKERDDSSKTKISDEIIAQSRSHQLEGISKKSYQDCKPSIIKSTIEQIHDSDFENDLLHDLHTKVTALINRASFIQAEMENRLEVLNTELIHFWSRNSMVED